MPVRVSTNSLGVVILWGGSSPMPLFARHDFVEASWALITPLHEAWRREAASVIPTYEAGGWGPAEADALMSRDGRRWRTL